MGVLIPSAAQTQAHKGAAAVPDHYRNRQSNHCHGKYDCICRISKGAEVAGIGDKNLIHHIVKRRHQQGDHTGDGITSHQSSYRLCFQKHI